jgi:pyoverdine/dityrosine biosynthesis protein Dit1
MSDGEVSKKAPGIEKDNFSAYQDALHRVIMKLLGCKSTFRNEDAAKCVKGTRKKVFPQDGPEAFSVEFSKQKRVAKK